MKSGLALAAPTIVEVGSVPEGKVADFLTGKHVADTPEEYVRQNIEKALVRQYRYAPADCEPEFRIKTGSTKPRVDIVVFGPGQAHLQENAYLLVETKKRGTNPAGKVDGIDQLKSYMASCLNAQYGLWTNGDDRYCFAKRSAKASLTFEEIIEIHAFGQSEADAQRPAARSSRAPTAPDS